MWGRRLTDPPQMHHTYAARLDLPSPACSVCCALLAAADTRLSLPHDTLFRLSRSRSLNAPVAKRQPIPLLPPPLPPGISSKDMFGVKGGDEAELPYRPDFVHVGFCT